MCRYRPAGQPKLYGDGTASCTVRKSFERNRPRQFANRRERRIRRFCKTDARPLGQNGLTVRYTARAKTCDRNLQTLRARSHLGRRARVDELWTHCMVDGVICDLSIAETAFEGVCSLLTINKDRSESSERQLSSPAGCLARHGHLGYPGRVWEERKRCARSTVRARATTTIIK